MSMKVSFFSGVRLRLRLDEEIPITFVKLILARGNPHYICDSRVLVKPYKEKEKLMTSMASFLLCISILHLALCIDFITVNGAIARGNTCNSSLKGGTIAECPSC
ncbi:hypothetical protein CRYUN_Cryun09bG0116700 [Craigia yunnanensis]